MSAALDLGPINARRMQTPGAAGWAKSVRPDAKNRYFVCTADSHANEPLDVYARGGIDPVYAPGRTFTLHAGIKF